jgi:hypothetical protein
MGCVQAAGGYEGAATDRSWYVASRTHLSGRATRALGFLVACQATSLPVVSSAACSDCAELVAIVPSDAESGASPKIAPSQHS